MLNCRSISDKTLNSNFELHKAHFFISKDGQHWQKLQ